MQERQSREDKGNPASLQTPSAACGTHRAFARTFEGSARFQPVPGALPVNRRSISWTASSRNPLQSPRRGRPSPRGHRTGAGRRATLATCGRCGKLLRLRAPPLKIAAEPLKKLRFRMLAERLHLDAAAPCAHIRGPGPAPPVRLVDARVRLFAASMVLRLGNFSSPAFCQEDRTGAVAHHNPVALAEPELEH